MIIDCTKLRIRHFWYTTVNYDIRMICKRILNLQVKLERDDEGTGTNSASQQNGNARTPIACCTIGRASPANWRTPYSEDDLMVMSGGAWSPNTGESCTKKPI